MPYRVSFGTAPWNGAENYATIFPTNIKSIIGRKPILLCHGRGGDAWQMNADPYTGHFIRPLVEAGYPLVSLDPGGAFGWGGAAAMTSIDNARAYLASQFGLSATECLMIGFSMGGLTALNYARLGVGVKGCAAICPAVDLVSLHTLYAAEIDAVYGGSSNWQANSANYDPTRSVQPSSVATKIWYATNDTAALTATQTDFLNANPWITGVSLGAVGHTPVTVPASAMLDFVTGIGF